MDYIRLSKEISYALRHAPWEYELEMDEDGFVPISGLLAALNESGRYKREIVKADLERIMEISDKRRHEIVGERIRALYGHSIPIHIRKTESVPPETLYHGTAKRFLPAIREKGLLPMNRQYVHLSCDCETALQVGKRRDFAPVILTINAVQAFENGVKFYIGNEKVWLCDNLPPVFIRF
ncbi:MAG: RNA 2'-phosphotransferase [Kiritimatiellae bacterium]|nr:RNA 2'-phosphotransferase [Kiritimatiellia bacterium]